MPADETHGRIRMLPRPEGDKLAVTLWGTEYVSSPGEWRELAARILEACPATVAKPKLTCNDLRAGMVCRMRKGGVRRIDAAGVGKWGDVQWTRIDPGPYCGRTGKMSGHYFAGDVMEVLSDG